MRAALYARFSSELQNAASIADQLAAARRHAERIGATVVAEFSDAAISGASMANRPGLNDLLAAARRRPRPFDVVICEALDRLTRSGGDAWDIFDDLKAQDVKISTVSEGDVSMLHVGVMGTMNAIFLDELGKKVRRGLTGVVMSGRHTSKPPYGYRRKLAYDAAGEPIRGVLEIDEVQAAVVRRIYADFCAGLTVYQIVAKLNDEGVPGPGGRLWAYTHVNGRAAYLDGILRNHLYAGERVFNRTHKVKDRRTGRQTTRANPPSEWIRQPAPELRIIDEPTWAKAQARLTAIAERVAASGNAQAGNAPKRLFSGLIRCGVCGGGMHTSGTNRGYRCLTRMNKGLAGCTNVRSPPADVLERQVLDEVRRDFLHPDVIEAAVREYHAARRKAGAGAAVEKGQVERDLAEARRRAARLVDQVAEGILTGPTVQAKLAELEARAAELQARLDELSRGAEIVPMIPSAAANYRRRIEALQQAIENADQGTAELAQAREALRKVIRAVVIHPLEGRGQWRAQLQGDLTSILLAASGDREVRMRRG